MKTKPAKKRPIPKDARNYYVTQPHTDTLQHNKQQLSEGKKIGDTTLQFKDGVLHVSVSRPKH
jgi:hypothetical protein